MTDDDKRAKILEAIRVQTDKGVALIQGEYTRCDAAQNCMCPMTCLVATLSDHTMPIEHGPEIDQQAARILGVDLLWVRGFIDGFDGGPGVDNTPGFESLTTFNRGRAMGLHLARHYHMTSTAVTEDMG